MARASAATIEPRAEAGLLAQEEPDLVNAYWRAANYLSVGQIYLYANPLSRGAGTSNPGCRVTGGRRRD